MQQVLSLYYCAKGLRNKESRSSLTAVILAADAISGASPASGVFAPRLVD